MDHVADKMNEAREEEKEHAKDLNEIANDIIKLCSDNAIDARKYAQETKRPQDFMFSSNAASHVLNFISKLKPEKDTSKGKAAIIEFIERERENEASEVKP